jgi:hypothetical protein
MSKSNMAVSTADSGKISRGREIFFMILAFRVMLGALKITAFEKKVQGTSAAKVNIGYGIPSLETFTTLRKRVKTTM